MTITRQRWLGSLPEAERKARLTIKMYEADIKIIKINLKYTCDEMQKRFFKNELRQDKERIKNLRKGIALNLTAEMKCPSCGRFFVFSERNIKQPEACPKCWQKLRW